MRSGAHLSDQGKTGPPRIRRTTFHGTAPIHTNVLEADRKYRLYSTRDDVQGLPAAVRDAAAAAAKASGDDGRYAFTLGKSSMLLSLPILRAATCAMNFTVHT